MKVDDKLLKKSLNAAIDFSVMKKEGHEEKKRNFDETVDFIINLKDLDLKDPKSRIDKELILPNDIIKKEIPNICVIASDEILLEAKKIGVDTLSPEELAGLDREEKKDKKKFVKKYDFFVVEDKLMRDVARYLARFLGPVGKMPKPFPSGYGIISSVDDLKNAVDRYKKIISLQVKKHPIVQVKVGKKSMEISKILENVKTIVDYIADLMPHKFNNFKSMYIKTTMGKPIKIDEDYLKQIGV
ncbi:MAG: 50S ribosomal protein L1 [Promethearchaeota archaeon]|nr:MAG: 50S ribosomal protein L1 [Candidatus Lokiarchaeota archaeon]